MTKLIALLLLTFAFGCLPAVSSRSCSELETDRSVSLDEFYSHCRGHSNILGMNSGFSLSNLVSGSAKDSVRGPSLSPRALQALGNGKQSAIRELLRGMLD